METEQSREPRSREASGYVPRFSYDYDRAVYLCDGIAAANVEEVVDSMNRTEEERHRLEHRVQELREEVANLEKGAVHWAIAAEAHRIEASNLAYALADALSTYGPAEEVRVTAERIEAWQQVLRNSKAHNNKAQ